MEKDDLPDALREHWHLDKRVPIALIVTLFVQTATIFWWAATTTERLAAVERRVETTAPYADRLTRVEVKMDYMTELLSRIDTTIRRSPQN